MPDPPNDRSVTFALFVGAVALYAFTALGFLDSFDGEMMFRVTESLVERGNLRVTDEVFHSNEPYALYGLGTSVVVLPWYLTARTVGLQTRWAASLLNPTVTAATVALLYAFGRRLAFPPRTSALLALVFGLATLAWPYSRFFFSEPLTAFLLLAAAMAGHSLRQRPTVRAAAVLGLTLGLAVLTREDSALFLPLYAAYLWWSGGRRATSASVLAALLVPLALLLALAAWYHALRFEGFVSGFEAKSGNAFVRDPLQFARGLYGQLFSTGKGLIWYSPVVLLAPFAWRRFARAAPAECVLFTSLIVARVVLFSSWQQWTGGISWGPRYLVPLLPFLVLPLGWLRAPRPLVAVVVAVSLLAQLPGVAMYYWEPFDFARERLGASWDDIYFWPTYSPIVSGFRLLLEGRVNPPLAAPDGRWSQPLRAALLLLAAGAFARLLAALSGGRGAPMPPHRRSA